MIAINVRQPLTDRPTWRILYFDAVPSVDDYFKFPDDKYHIFQVTLVFHLPTTTPSSNAPRITIHCVKAESTINGIDYRTAEAFMPGAEQTQ